MISNCINPSVVPHPLQTVVSNPGSSTFTTFCPLSFPGRLAGNATNRTTNKSVCPSAVPSYTHSLRTIQNVFRTSCICGGTGQTIVDPLPPPPSLCVRFMLCPFLLRLIDNYFPVFLVHIRNRNADLYFVYIHRDITMRFRYKHPPGRFDLCTAVFAFAAFQRGGAIRAVRHTVSPFPLFSIIAGQYPHFHQRRYIPSILRIYP